MVLLYAAGHILMSRMKIGRYLYAVGGNREAARLSGVPVTQVLLFAYTVSGLLAGLGLSLQYGLKGCLLIHGFDEKVWDRRLYVGLAPVYLLILVGLLAWIFFGPKPRGLRGPIFPHAAGAMWLVVLVQNAIAQAITGPHSNWNETAFSIYYALLFATTMSTVFYFQTVKKLDARQR